MMGSTSANRLETHTALHHNGKMYFLYQNGSVSSNQSSNMRSRTLIEIGKWHHLAITYDVNEEAILYLDGNEEARRDLGSKTFANIAPTFIRFGRPGSNRHKFSGSIDELRVWDDVRTSAEINDNLDKELTGWEENLIALYKINEGTVGEENPNISRIIDQTGNNSGAVIEKQDPDGSSSNFTVGAPVHQVCECN